MEDVGCKGHTAICSYFQNIHLLSSIFYHCQHEDTMVSKGLVYHLRMGLHPISHCCQKHLNIIQPGSADFNWDGVMESSPSGSASNAPERKTPDPPRAGARKAHIPLGHLHQHNKLIHP